MKRGLEKLLVVTYDSHCGNRLIGGGLQSQMRADESRIVEVTPEKEIVMEIYFPAYSGLYNVWKR
jgi:hypothetical protein